MVAAATRDVLGEHCVRFSAAAQRSAVTALLSWGAGRVPLEAWPFHLCPGGVRHISSLRHGSPLPLHEKDPVVPWPPPGNPADPRPVSGREAAVAPCGLASSAGPAWQADPSGTTVTWCFCPWDLPGRAVPPLPLSSEGRFWHRTAQACGLLLSVAGCGSALLPRGREAAEQPLSDPQACRVCQPREGRVLRLGNGFVLARW